METATTTLGSGELSRRARVTYDRCVRAKVETPENIGKLIVIDVDTGDYAIDKSGLSATRNLQARNPNAVLFEMRIGYDVAYELGGFMERTTP